MKQEDIVDPWSSESCEPEAPNGDLTQQSSPPSGDKEIFSSSPVDAEEVIKSISENLLQDKTIGLTH